MLFKFQNSIREFFYFEFSIFIQEIKASTEISCL